MMKTKAIIIGIVFAANLASAAFLLTEEEAVTVQRVQTISRGIQAYWDTYRELPLNIKPDTFSADIIDVLIGKDLWGQNKNKKVFIEDSDFKSLPEKYPLRITNGPLLDAWGNGIIINIDFTTHRVEIRSSGPNGIVDDDIGDDIIETIQFEK